MNYYNDNEPFACQWLDNLIAAGELPGRVVDSRSITEVLPDGLDAFTQCHFFAGIGGWSLALRWAEWPEDRPVWTGSCPCQPFSQAGKHQGESDVRHLWPEFLRLIIECHPRTIFGEQVASPAGREWLAGVRVDLEALGYAVGAADLCAASTGAPHIRQRLFWVADTEQHGHQGGLATSRTETSMRRRLTEQGAQTDRLADTGGLRWAGQCGQEQGGSTGRAFRHSEVSWLGNADSSRRDGGAKVGCHCGETTEPLSPEGCVVIYCRDGKTRRVPDSESGLFPLAHGIPRKLGPPLTGMGQVGIRAARANRAGCLKGYGNAIVPQLAAEFIAAYMDVGGKTKEVS